MSLVSPDNRKRPIDIVVPFYRNANLVPALIQSLAQVPVRNELARLGCSLIAVNDSPDDSELNERLRRAVADVEAFLPCQLLENEQNLGFVGSVNRALQITVNNEHDAIILNSDTIVCPGAFSEICSVAYMDPMIGFVSPRSNNASLCSLPHQDQYKKLCPAESNEMFTELSQYLPQFHFVPVGVGFCLFIKCEVLREFGLLDGVYSPGYNEENDLMMRANRCGYRVALANRAFVYHIGEASFSQSQSPKHLQEEKNAAVLNQRYPEYQPSVQRYFDGAHFQAEQVLAGLLPDRAGRLDLLFDFSSIGLYYNGTFLASKTLLERAAKFWPQFNIHVMTSEAAWKFHKLYQIDRAYFVPIDVRRKFAVAFRFAQPFSFEDMARLNRLAPLNVYAMLDPIAFDCMYLNNRNADDLETLWSAVFSHADGVVYLSDFVAELFRRRFRLRSGLHQLIAYPSLETGDYCRDNESIHASSQYILVIGNRFEHKRVLITTEALSRAFPKDKIVLLGYRYDGGQNVVSFESGHLEEDEIRKLLAAASFVVFPSTYEGFGFPIVESLAWRKPVLARDIPVARDIREKLGADQNLILYSSTQDLIERLKSGFPAWRENGNNTAASSSANWDATSLKIGNFITDVVRSFDFQNVLVPRTEHMHILGQAGGRTVNSRPSLRGYETLASDLRDQIRDIHGSWSWRLTSPVRKIGSAYLQMLGKDKFKNLNGQSR
jgi:GT2 family glycosyltransferase/glycosyltransferase involved in cell wall biosynthesis